MQATLGRFMAVENYASTIWYATGKPQSKILFSRRGGKSVAARLLGIELLQAGTVVGGSMAKATFLSAFVLGMSLSGVLCAAEARKDFNIASQDLASSLNEFAVTANIQIVFAPELVRNVRAPAVVGSFTQQEA